MIIIMMGFPLRLEDLGRIMMMVDHLMVKANIIFNLQDSTSASTTSMTRKKTINIRDLFVEPNFHELEVDDNYDGEKNYNNNNCLRH